MSSHHQEVRFLRQQAKEAKKAITSITNCVVVVFFRNKSLNQLVRVQIAAIERFLELSFQIFVVTSVNSDLKANTSCAVHTRSSLLLNMMRWKAVLASSVH